MILAGDPDLEEVGKADRCRSVLQNAGTPVAEVTALARLCPEPDGTKHVSLLVGDRNRRFRPRHKDQRAMCSETVWNGPIPGGSLYRVAVGPESPVKELYVTSSEFECALRARYLSVPELALLMTVQCGTFRELGDQMAYEQSPFTTVDKLCAQADSLGEGWYARRRFARAVNMTLEGCASVPEAKVGILLSAPRSMGGWGLKRPKVNAEVEIPEDVLPLVENRRRFIFDQDYGCATWLEYDGKGHEEAEDSILDDKEKILAAVAMGGVVLPVTRRTMESYERFEVVARTIERRVLKVLPECNGAVAEAQKSLFNTFKGWDPVC